MAQTAPVDDWQGRGACASLPQGPVRDAFFPEPRSKKKDIEAAKNVCRRCSVRKDCYDWAMSQQPMPQGIWGGLEEHDRLYIKENARV